MSHKLCLFYFSNLVHWRVECRATLDILKRLCYIRTKGITKNKNFKQKNLSMSEFYGHHEQMVRRENQKKPNLLSNPFENISNLTKDHRYYTEPI